MVYQTVRWQFFDPATNETDIVPINPNTTESPETSQVFKFGVGFDGRVTTIADPVTPVDWSFGGVIRSQAHNDLLEKWEKKPGKVRVTDHLGRTFEVMMRQLEVTDRKPTPQTPWRLEYTMHALLLRRLA